MPEGSLSNVPSNSIRTRAEQHDDREANSLDRFLKQTGIKLDPWQRAVLLDLQGEGVDQSANVARCADYPDCPMLDPTNCQCVYGVEG